MEFDSEGEARTYQVGSNLCRSANESGVTFVQCSRKLMHNMALVFSAMAVRSGMVQLLARRVTAYRLPTVG